MNPQRRLSPADLLQLQRLNTPTIYNGWEQITKRDATREGFNLEEVRDFMPHLGVMAGYAITVVIQPGNAEHARRSTEAWAGYRAYVASQPAPKIVVVQDLDKPHVFGAFWGEVNSSVHRTLGCVGTIIDGGIRDLAEMNAVGFKALARRLCVGHAASCPVRWDCEVEVFGRKVQPGQLLHADQHGFLAIPPEDESRLLEAARFMDANECSTLISAARFADGQTSDQILSAFNEAVVRFNANTTKQFGSKGEW